MERGAEPGPDSGGKRGTKPHSSLPPPLLALPQPQVNQWDCILQNVNSGLCWPRLTSKKGCTSQFLPPPPRSPCCSSSCPPGSSSGGAKTRLRRCRKQPRHLVLSWASARYIRTMHILLSGDSETRRWVQREQAGKP